MLRGQSTGRLDQALFLYQSPGQPVLASDLANRPADVQSIMFVPGIRALPGTVITAHGVRVTSATGEVEAIPAPAPVVRNLLIEAVVAVQGRPDPFRVVLRVHVHGAVRRAWCTPDQLSIHHGADGQRLSVLAEFDDDTVGDITHHPGITWASAAPAVTVVPATGALTGTAVTPAGAPVQITATLPADLGGGVAAAAEVAVLPAWSAQPATVRAATWIAGPGRPAFGYAPNVLFLAEGFIASDQTAFEQFTAELVRQIHSSPSVSPFNLLRDSINYWRAFVPSRQTGLSTLHELDLGPSRGIAFIGETIPRPRRPDPLRSGVSGILELDELIHEVGLPVPADGTGSVTFAAKLLEWATLYRVNTNRVDAALFDRWKALSDRRIANERDTAFGLAAGQRPAAAPLLAAHGIQYHPLRTNRDHLDQFLATLTDGLRGPVIGSTWIRQPVAGKDRDLVVALCAGALGAGAQTVDQADIRHSLLVAAGLASTLTVPLTAVGGSREVDVAPHPIPRGTGGAVLVDKQVLARVVHETAHSLGLADEYGGPGELPADVLPYVRNSVNLGARADLVKAPGGPLTGEQIRWRWPRLGLAGQTAGPVFADGGGIYRVQLRPGHVAGFTPLASLTPPDNVVHLRQPLTVAGAVLVSGPLQVEAILVADQVRLRDPAGALAAADYPAGSVLCQPVAAPASAAGDAYAELMAQAIRTHITAKHGPLNAPPSAPDRPCAQLPSPNQIQNPTNLPSGLAWRRGRPRNWIVGLYEGGAGYDCGVYHPTGICLMRFLQVPPDDPRATGPTPRPTRNPGAIYRLCHVCQYVLVDLIDPRQHDELDRRLIRREYPQP